MGANSYRNVFLTNLDGILQTGTSLDLAIGQIGIVDAKTNNVSTAPNFPTVRDIQIVYGTSDRKLPKGMFYSNANERSPIIPASKDIKFSALKAQKPQNMIVTLGYDGVDATKTMSPRVGKDVRVYLTLTGQPVANLVANTGNHPASLTETFDLKLPCVDECSDNCVANVDCQIVADAFIESFNTRKLPGGQFLSDYVKVTKLTHCETPSGLPTVDCQKWTLTIADTGTQDALGAVQAQYPGDKIVRKSRDGVYSTYETTLCDNIKPAAFENSANPVIPNCTTCPSGYSLVDEYTVFTIVRAGNISASTIASAYTGLIVSGSTVKLSFANGVSTFQVYVDGTSLAAQAADIVAQIGTVQSVCVLDGDGTTTAWTEGDACTKAEKTYQISLKNDQCGSTFLTQLQADYEGVGTVTLVETNSDTCTTLYQIVIESDNAICDTCDEEFYKFSKPADFNGAVWTEVQGQTGYGQTCVCGLKFESAYVQRDRKECFFEAVSYEVEPLFLYVSTNNPDFRDYSTLCNDDETFPVTLVQQAKYAQGYGSFVADQVKLSNFYFNKPWYNDPAVRDAIGYELGVDLQGYYDEYILEWTTPIAGTTNVSGFGFQHAETYEYHFYFPAGGGVEFQNAINAWLSSVQAQPLTI